jgi:hypothetical protein
VRATPPLDHLVLAVDGLVSVASKSARLSHFAGAADRFVAGFRTFAKQSSHLARIIGESGEDFLCLGKIERSLVRSALWDSDFFRSFAGFSEPHSIVTSVNSGK